MEKAKAWKKRLFTALSVSSLSLLLVGCGTTAPESAPQEPASANGAPAQEPASAQEPVDHQNKPSGQDPDTPVVKNLERPEKAEIKLNLEGMEETETGTLTKSSDQKYSFYLLPGFEWTAEEPGKDLISFKNDDRFNMRIEKIGSVTNLEDLRKNMEEELAMIGKVEDVKNAGISEPFKKNAILYLRASSEDLTKNIVVTAIDGTMFRFTMSLPHTEAAEGVEPRFWAMLETLKTGD
ncbi:MAG: hypothetical protein BAA01_04655 [Bacillus thermozeamaize]|jgi:hypothetical protein|uniref:PsbP C-terminal domain-containing protein n=1 Tax=Bacillus thermozeamaize TaxID=230954 RepID=A0A1Y3PAH4_9BACI|nr:MAG: hypothetical protein BAA01_04655 [Bacillus thermozeamaize]